MSVDIGDVVALLVSVGSLYVAWKSSRASAKKDEVDALRGIIDELESQVKRLQVKVEAWQRRFVRVCRRAGLDPDEQITGPLGGLEGWDVEG